MPEYPGETQPEAPKAESSIDQMIKRLEDTIPKKTLEWTSLSRAKNRILLSSRLSSGSREKIYNAGLAELQRLYEKYIKNPES